MQKECITNFNERCQRSVIVDRLDIQESVLLRARFLDMPRNAKVASVGTYLAKSFSGLDLRDILFVPTVSYPR